jgi:hypothetical protein
MAGNRSVEQLAEEENEVLTGLLSQRERCPLTCNSETTLNPKKENLL